MKAIKFFSFLAVLFVVASGCSDSLLPVDSKKESSSIERLLGGTQDGNTSNQVVQNDVFWKDTSGNPIYSQGGGVLKVGDTYYWYGVKYNGAVTYYNDPSAGENDDHSFNAITIYSSTDLTNWTFEGNALTASDLGPTSWVGRVGVARNPNTGQYVLISQLDSGLMFATSSTPTGDFTFQCTQSSIENVVNDMSGDQSVFVDDDGTAYLVFSNREGRSHLYVSPLRSSDYLHVDPATEVYNAPAGREGNIMFKHNGTYYLCSSDLHGWNASHMYCITSTDIYGPYSSEFVVQGTDADFSHVSQTGLAVEVNGTSGSFVIFGGDRWSDFAGNGIGYNQWVPITFDGTTPIFHSLSQWTIDADAGTWSVGSGNNYVLNPNMEADRIEVGDMTGWTNWVGSGSNPNGNYPDSHNPGNFCMEQWSSEAYEASMYQNISLPNGTYTLSAWVRSSGGQNIAHIYAKDFGGSQMDYSVNMSISSWTKISITDINVTNGSIEVGVYSDANAGNWVNVDDFSLVQTGGGGTSTYVKLKNRATGLYIDGMGRTTNGANAGQWGSSSSYNQQWVIESDGSYVRIKNRYSGLYLDGMGRTSNGSDAGQWGDSNSYNQQWSEVWNGSYVRFKNRATGLYLDGMGRTSNGTDLGQWGDSNSYNQQWQIVTP